MFSSSGFIPPDAESVNPGTRNRRRPNAAAGSATGATANDRANGHGSSSLLGWNGSSSTSRNGNGSSASSTSTGGTSRTVSGSNLLGSASGWSIPNWSSIQELASSLLSVPGDDAPPGSRGHSTGGRLQDHKTRKNPDVWGPAPPGESSSGRPRLKDVAAGPTAAREAELRARKTASVLESHPGVNGGLDVRGKYKRRNSDENLQAAARGDAAQEAEDCLVYIHHVKPVDTYFGIVLKYRCREDAFRRANGLWNRDNIQVRKWVALPVDMCEIKGRPCDDPSLVSASVDPSRSTPTPTARTGAGTGDSSDYFGTATTKSTTSLADDAAEPPWTHVRWVRLESCPDPVEIARISRNALGFFPPRRKKSLHSTVSTVSTPRQSLDGPANGSLSDRTAGMESPSRVSSRQSLAGGRMSLGAPSLSSASPSSHTGSRSAAVKDTRPEWMRRPGGVGSMNRSVRAPGPARDPLNKWTTKHLPGLNIETLPSMSVMGSETAHFGFAKDGGEAPGLVESSFEAGRDDLTSSGRQDSSLDKAAASIETWLRGAFAKRPGTPGGLNGSSMLLSSSSSSSYGGRPGRQLEEETIGDLIELEVGPYEDSRHSGHGGFGSEHSSNTTPTNTTSGWRADGGGGSLPRGRSTKGKKAD